MGTYHRWQDIRKKKLTPKELEQIDHEVDQELIEMDLKEIRAMTNTTQNDIAAKLDMAQPEVSQLERRQDMRLSTLRRYIKALGGEIEVHAVLGDKRVRLRTIG